ncbi:hypothetical protein G6F59_016092 [Rhizopus arrhizus]|nr:hypothetical protein G6F59_016092 [Rhizopus arrhizus]
MGFGSAAPRLCWVSTLVDTPRHAWGQIPFPSEESADSDRWARNSSSSRSRALPVSAAAAAKAARASSARPSCCSRSPRTTCKGA